MSTVSDTVTKMLICAHISIGYLLRIGISRAYIHLQKILKNSVSKWLYQLHSHPQFLLSDFSGGPVLKNPPVNAVDTSSIPGPGKSHMSRLE